MRFVSLMMSGAVALFITVAFASDATPRSQVVEPSAAPSESQRAPVADRPFVLDAVGNRVPVTQGAAAGYVPDTACRSCHPYAYDIYRSHGMARSFYRPSPENVIENFTHAHYYHPASDRHYEMSWRDGRLYQKRYQLDADGKAINVIEWPIDYIMGSGNHVRTYLRRTPAGEIYQLPVAWYTQERRWAMNPGYDNAQHPGFTRQVKRECMACHNAYPEAPAGADRMDHPHVFPEDLPEGIGCQRCHGPGAEHMRVAVSSGSSIRAIRDSIVNPARLDPPLREDVCLQCHLQPTSHANSFARLNEHGEYAYRPGQPLSDVMMVVDYNDEADRAARFEINHHPYRLHRSRCYKESSGALDCLTCHDPHRKTPPSERIEHYRARCLTCHRLDDCGVSHMAEASAHVDAAALAANDCVTCHMPQRRTQDVVHVVMTDHLIRRAPAPADWLTPLEEHTPPLSFPPEPYFRNRAPAPPMLDVYLAMFGVPRGDPERVRALESAIEAADTDAFDPLFMLVEGYGAIGAHNRAAALCRQLLDRFPRRTRLWSLLAFYEAKLGNLDDAMVHIRHAVSQDSESPEARFLMGSLLLARGETVQAIAHLKEAVRLRPVHVDALMNLGQAYARRGDLMRAVASYRDALAVNPTDGDAYVHMGVTLIAAGELTEAVRYATHGLRYGSANGRLPAVRAAALALAGDTKAARAAAEKAKLADADATTIQLITGLCDISEGLRETARRAYELAQASIAAATETSPLQRILLNELRLALERTRRNDR